MLSFISYHTFSIQVKGIEPNHPKKPRVIWCSIDDEFECEKLHALIESALLPLGILPDERRFKPHATVCRVKEADTELLKALIPLKEKIYGKVKVQGFTLKKSTLTSDGPIYQDILGVNWN